MINRVTGWPEVIPTNNITNENIAKIIILNWIARFSTTVRILTDYGR